MKSIKGKLQKGSLKSLVEIFFVREELNQEHVLHLAELIESGKKLPPIMITDKNELVDGRHRKAAYELLEIDDVELEVIPSAKRSELMFIALACNVGGPLPPSRRDIAFTVKLLLGEKVSRKHIIEQINELTGFPNTVIQNYLDKVQADMANARVRAAVRSVVNDSLPLKKAAELHDVKVETLQKALDPERKPEERVPNHEIKAGLSTTARVYSTGIAKKSKELIRDYMDGIITEKDVREVFSHIKHLTDSISSVQADWQNRLEAIVTKTRENDTLAAEELIAKPTPQSRRQNSHPGRTMGRTVLDRILAA